MYIRVDSEMKEVLQVSAPRSSHTRFTSPSRIVQGDNDIIKRHKFLFSPAYSCRSPVSHITWTYPCSC
jgi:hypothetical protein